MAPLLYKEWRSLPEKSFKREEGRLFNTTLERGCQVVDGNQISQDYTYYSYENNRDVCEINQEWPNMCGAELECMV